MSRIASGKIFYNNVNALTSWNYTNEFIGIVGSGKKEHVAMVFGITSHHDFSIRYYNSGFILINHNGEYLDVFTKEDALKYIAQKVASSRESVTIEAVREALILAVKTSTAEQLVGLVELLYGRDGSVNPVIYNKKVSFAPWMAEIIKTLGE